jgi:hypothetical protein
MRARSVPAIVLALVLAGYVLAFPAFERQRAPVKKVQARGLILPPPVMKLLSLEFRTITADFLFARASQYFGGKIGQREPASAADMQWLYRNLLVITDLDPYFEDPYYFGNALFTWDAGMYNEANTLLKKATEARTWDWQFPFFLGFNKFYFQNDRNGGADYLLIASKRPGAWPGLPTLAARLYSDTGRTESAIAFLIQFWENANDPKIKKSYEVRIDALKRILFLERAVSRYRQVSGRNPVSLEVLVSSGVIREIPKDPYGGRFYLDKDGSIKTTSKLAFKPQQAPQQNK